MSDIMRRVVTLFEARGAEQIRASMGSMRTDFSSYRREIDATSRTQGILNGQMRALGTTVRYAFAGSAVYGVMSMVRELSQFQSRLGEISSIATTTGGIPLVGRQLDQLGDDLINVSTRTTAPIDDLEQGVISLYSTIGDVPPDEAARMMETIAEVSITAQSNIEDTTQALLGMLDAFGKGTSELPKFGDEFYKVIQLSAGMPGHIYAQQLGRLSASATLSGFTPEQMGALSIGATRSGGSPATNMRGLAQLMTFVMNPTSPKTEAAFAGIGLGRNRRNQLGGYGTLQEVLKQVNQRGLSGKPRGLSDDAVSAITDLYGQDNAPNTALGISGGGGELLAKLFPRIEGRRIAAVLAKIQTPEQVAGTPNKTMAQYLGEVTNSAGQTDKAMSRAMDRRRIQQAGNAIHNLGLEISTAFSPLLQLPARGITSLTQNFGNQNPNVRLAEVIGGGAGLAALIRRFGASGITRGGVGGLAAVDALTQGPGGARGSSPLNPIYVIQVGQLFGGRGSGIPNKDLRRAEGELGAGTGVVNTGRRAPTRGGRGMFSRLGRLGRLAPMLLGPEAFVAGQVLTLPGEHQGGGNDPMLKKLIADMASGKVTPANMTAAQQAALAQFGPGRSYANLPEDRRMKAEQILEKAAARRQATQGVNVQGKAQLDVNVTQQDAQGNVTHRKKAKVTLDLFPGFTVRAPQQKAKPKSHRGGN